MSRYERDTSLSTAMAKRIHDARQTKEFQDAMAHAQTVANGIAMSGNVEYLKQHGGWTKIITDAFNEWAGNESVPGPFGTRLTIKSLLTPVDVQEIRTWAQKNARS